MKNLIIALLAGSFLLSITACDPAKKYASELSQIESAMAQLDSLELSFGELPMDTLTNLFAKVKGDMKMLQETYSGEMPLELGVTFSRYRDVPNNIKNLKDLKKGFPESIAFSRKQLADLKDAIVTGANRDSKGNSINEEYIKKYVAEETKVVDDLVQQMDRMKKGSVKAFEDYEMYYPQVSATLDSLRNL